MATEETYSPPADWTDYRPISAMFVDLEGSVAMLSRMGPEAYNNALRAFHNLVTLRVRKFDGEIAQYLGDGVLCFFHRGRGNLDRASAAIAAAIDIMAANTPDAGQIRIGIASGLALFNDERTAAGARVVGNCINLAARIQAQATPGTILTCDESRRSGEGHFGFEKMAARQLKGFDDTVQLWRVQDRKLRRQHMQPDFPSPSSVLPVIGRDAELTQLRSALTQTCMGRDQAVAILGEAGLGKTRLIQEFLRDTSVSDCAKLVWRCSRDEAGRDFHPLRSYLQWVVGVAPSDDNHARATKLRKLFSGVWGLNPEQVGDMLLVLGAHPEKDAQPTGTPLLLRRWLAQELLARLIEIRGSNPALILVLEDAHWLDPSTAEFLEALRPSLGAEHILLLFTQRTAGPQDPPVMEAQRLVRLAPLSSAQSTALVHAVFSEQAADADALAWVCAKASGVPLFISVFAEFARRQSGAGVDDAPLPIDLLDLLEQSLSRLPAATRRFAQAAAVMGAAFEPELIAALQDEDENAMTAHMRLLAHERLIGKLPNGAGANFTHDLLREAIYDNLGRELRRRLHGALADLMATGAPPDVLARHYERAGRPDEAITHYHSASLASARVGALQEAKGYLDQAFSLIALLDPPAHRLEQELALRGTEGPLHMILGGPGSQAFGTAQRRAAELAAELGLTHDRTHLLYNSGLHHWARLRLSAAATQADHILAIPNGGEEAQLAGHTLAGLVAWHRGNNAEARGHLSQTIALYRIEAHAGMFRSYLKDFGVFSLFYAGLDASISGDFATAQGFAARAQQTGEALDIPHSRGFGLLAQLMTALLRNDPEAALHYGQLAERLAQTHRFPEFEAMGIFAQGWALSQSKTNRAQGIARMTHGLAAWQRTDFLAWQSMFEAFLIDALVEDGLASQAKGHLDQLKKRMLYMDEHQFFAPARIAEARFLAAVGNSAKARECLSEAINHARAKDAWLWVHKAELASAQIDGHTT